MKKITLDEFENGAEFIVSDEILPTAAKIAYARNLVDSVKTEAENGIVYYDEVLLEVYSDLYAIDLYTNIKIEEINFDDYDKCLANGLIKELKAQSEDCAIFMNICKKTLKQKEKETDSIVNYFNSLVTAVNNVANHINGLLNEIDQDKLNKSIGESLKLVANKIPDLNNKNSLNSILKAIQAVKGDAK